MSEATIFECPYNLFLKQRLEFVVICQDHLEASIMRIIEYEMIKRKEEWQDKVTLAIETKKTPPRAPKDYWARLSQSQIIAKLYLYDSAKLTKPEDENMESEAWVEYRRKKALSISKSTLRKAIDRLIEKGFLLMRSKPGDEFGAPLYTLHRAHVQEAINMLPENPYAIFNVWGVSNFESGESQIFEGESQNLEVPPSKIETPTFKNANSHFQNLEVNKDITKDILLESSVQEESMFGANAPARAELKAEIKAGSHLEAEIQEAAENITDLQTWKEDTGKQKAVKPLKLTTSSRPGSRDDAALTDLPASASSTSSGGPRASGISPKSDTREIQKRIDAWRGYALEEKVEIVRERTALKSWCNLHTVEEYEQVMQYLTSVDSFWKKEENKHRIGGLTLAKETPKALASLARPPTNGGHAPPTDIYTQASLDPERNQRNIERLKARAAARQAAAEAERGESHGIA